MRPVPRPVSGHAAFIALALVLGALLAWPLRNGHAYLDDHVFLALARHIESPWALLFQDSLGAFFFRPLGMFSWWLSVKALGAEAPAQLAVNVALHTANGMLIYALLRQLAIAPIVAALAGLLFIAHPAAFSAAAWLSDRFDLLATLFGLLGLIAVERFLRTPSKPRMAMAAVALLAAILSKETGFALTLVAALMIAWRIEGSHASGARARRTLLAVIAAVAVAALAVRPLVLRPVDAVMFLKSGVLATLWGGATKWLAHLPDFFVVLQGSALAVAAWGAALIALAVVTLLPPALTELRTANRLRIAATGLALALSTALAQAPVFLASPIFPYALEGKALFEPLAASRFYYLPLAGLALVLAVMGDAVAASRPRIGHIATVVAIAAACAVVGMATSSRAIGRAWAVYPALHGEPVVRAAIAAVAKLSRAQPGCKLYLLATPPWASATLGMLDTAVKKSLPRGHPAMRCFIQAEHSPWYHLVEARGLGEQPQAPMETIGVGGKPFPPLRVSNLEFHYLKLVDRPEMIDDPRATFFAWQEGTFVDVTDDVRARRRAVRFYDNRPPY